MKCPARPGRALARRSHRGPHPGGSDRGFVLAYLMFALALVGVVTVGLSQMRSIDIQSQQVAANVDRISSGINTIRGQVAVCVAGFATGGDVVVDGAAAGTTVRTEWPARLVDGNLSTAAGPAADMQCPGAPADTRAMWTGRDGVFLPNPGAAFGPWQYVLVTGGTPLRVTAVTVTIANASGGSGLATLRRVVQRFPGGAVTLNEGTGILTVRLHN